jgi:hypothetical protein
MAPLPAPSSADNLSSEPMPSDPAGPQSIIEAAIPQPARDSSILPMTPREHAHLSALNYEPYPVPPQARLRLVKGGRTPNAIAEDLAAAVRERFAIERTQAELLGRAQAHNAQRAALLEREGALRREFDRLVLRLAEC